MTRKRPRPIRLTEKRALALLEAAERGTREWELEILADVDSTDLDTQRAAKERDLVRASALDGMAVVRARYLDGPEPTEPTPTLF